MKKVYFFLWFVLSSVICAQQTGYINTDRPDQSEGIYTLLKGKFQIEDGFTFSDENISNNLMLRYGLVDGTEIRLSSDFEKNNLERIQVDNVTLSCKQRIFEEKDNLPALTLVGYLAYKKYPKEWQTDIYLAFENNFSEKFVLCYNVGTSDFFRHLNITTQLGYSFTNQCYTFLEYYAVFGKQLPLHNFDTGILYAFNPNFQVDMCLGHSIFRQDDSWFVSVGVSHRFF